MLKSPAFSTSFLESRMILKLKSRKSRIKPGLFAFLLAERIIFGKKTHNRKIRTLCRLARGSDFFIFRSAHTVSRVAFSRCTSKERRLRTAEGQSGASFRPEKAAAAAFEAAWCALHRAGKIFSNYQWYFLKALVLSCAVVYLDGKTLVNTGFFLFTLEIGLL